MELNDQMEARLAKLSALRDGGTDPFPPRTEPVTPVPAVVAAGETDCPVCVAGRIRSRREHGKTVFAHLWGQDASIQVYFRRDDMPAGQWDLQASLDLGDIIRVEGPVFTTRTGELTIAARAVAILSKSLRTLPVVKTDSAGNVWDAVTDTEFMYRHRCVDLIVNPASRARLQARSRIVSGLRSYLDENGFLEVETPVLQPIYGGASAEPFMTHYNELEERAYLRIATELFLKRLLVGGFDRVYEMGKDFRNEGIDRTHSPEFTQLEIYEAFSDYNGMMRRLEEMVACASESAGCGRSVVFRGREIVLAPPFERISYVDSLRKASGEDLFSWDPKDLRRLCDRLEIAPGITERETLLDKLFDHYVTEGLYQPTFVLDYPQLISPLAKQKPGSPGITERFEAFVAGLELANSFSEQNDPLFQRKVLEEQAAASAIHSGEVDEDFLYALEIGMPPAGGLGMGIDRLCMILTDAASIRDVILFPHLRRLKP
jgi:lysyl-tRNA synthetase class 2